jgi:hypothetical protein
MQVDHDMQDGTAGTTPIEGNAIMPMTAPMETPPNLPALSTTGQTPGDKCKSAVTNG